VIDDEPDFEELLTRTFRRRRFFEYSANGDTINVTAQLDM
jgi:hypothetical protein